MRLIDADALKEYVKKVEDNESAYTICAYIDNAPTIEPFEKIGAICNENCGCYR